ncbi:TPA: polysaccharide pyruvyl transferase family protein [Raoultella ornithinolytica]
MKLYYYESKLGNFGDDLNKWLWDELLPDYFDNDESVRFSGIGTIITDTMPKSNKWIVFSSGVGYGYPPTGFGSPEHWDIMSVRGPLSAHVLGIDNSKAITDGAALLSVLPEFRPLQEDQREGIIFIPHHNALETGRWQEVCKACNVEFVNPTHDAKYVIQKIRSSKLVLADAMHAAIIADAMRVPWVPLVTSNQINTFKWLDWTQSIQVEYTPLVLGSSSFREAWRNLFLFSYGEKFFVPGFKKEDAISYFKFQRKLKSKWWWKNYMEFAKLITYRIPNKTLKIIETKGDFNWDAKFIGKASNMLQKAAAQKGFLSKNDVFEENVRKLLANIEKLKLQVHDDEKK